MKDSRLIQAPSGRFWARALCISWLLIQGSAWATIIVPDGGVYTANAYSTEDIEAGREATVNVVAPAVLTGTVSGTGATVNAAGGAVLGGISLGSEWPDAPAASNIGGTAFISGMGNPAGNALTQHGGVTNISGGAILMGELGDPVYPFTGGLGLSAYGGTLNMSGGSILGGAAVGEQSVNISGGFIDELYVSAAYTGETLSISGGEFGRFGCSQCYGEAAPMTVSGGTFHEFWLGETGNFHLLGGRYDGDLVLSSGSELGIYGGLFHDAGMTLWEENSADFFGYDLRREYTGRLGLFDTFLVTGTLLDGSLISLPIAVADYGPAFPYGSTVRVYNVPEASPAALTGVGLLALMLAGLGARPRRRRGPHTPLQPIIA